MTGQELMQKLLNFPVEKLNQEIYFCYTDGYESDYIEVNINEVRCDITINGAPSIILDEY